MIVLISATGGLRRGLVLSAFSLLGLAAGAYLGSRIAPHVLHGGSSSKWTPVAGLVGAVLGAMLLQFGALVAGSFIRGGLRLAPLRMIDSAGGLLLGAAIGLAIVWVGASAALLDARPDRDPRGGRALGDRQAARLGPAAAHAPQPPRTDRSIPVDHRAEGAHAAAEQGRPARPVDPRSGHARRQGARDGMRGRGGRERLVRRAESRRDRRARRRGGGRPVRRHDRPDPGTADPGTGRRRRARRPQRLAVLRGRCDQCGAAAARGSAVGRSRRDHRLPARRRPHGDAGTYRRDGDRADAGCARPRAGGSVDHRSEWEGRARRLRWPGRRQGGPGRVVDLRRAARLGEWLRRSAVDHPRRPRPRRPSTPSRPANALPSPVRAGAGRRRAAGGTAP